MRTLTEQLTQYARYHRDPRNIATHFIGIPMIVLAIAVLLSKPALVVSGLTITPAMLLMAVFTLYYLKLSAALGVLMGVLLSVCLYSALQLSSGTTAEWLSWGIGLFVVGWVFQFVGHFYEGKKPAFVDDLVGLVIGPLFVMTEALFMLGMLSSLKSEIEAGAGPVQVRQKADATS